MREMYETPNVELVEVIAEDVIMTSGIPENGDEGGSFDD